MQYNHIDLNIQQVVYDLSQIVQFHHDRVVLFHDGFQIDSLAKHHILHRAEKIIPIGNGFI
jgi:hypothetical protein